MSGIFLGEIRLFPYNFAPRNWAFCAGQIMPIAQNTALFSLLGTTFGGNGQTTFALPDLRGRVPISAGQGPGLADCVLGEVAGTESVTLSTAQLPSHTHNVNATATASSKSPAGMVPGYSAGGTAYGPVGAIDMAANMLDPVGGGAPFDNHPPYLVLNYCIALYGIFPSRN
jgi:microcystin-dependent protein